LIAIGQLGVRGLASVVVFEVMTGPNRIEFKLKVELPAGEAAC
jgi:hypothetical protein